MGIIYIKDAEKYQDARVDALMWGFNMNTCNDCLGVAFPSYSTCSS